MVIYELTQRKYRFIYAKLAFSDFFLKYSLIPGENIRLSHILLHNSDFANIQYDKKIFEENCIRYGSKSISVDLIVSLTDGHC